MGKSEEVKLGRPKGSKNKKKVYAWKIGKEYLIHLANEIIQGKLIHVDDKDILIKNQDDYNHIINRNFIEQALEV